MDTPTCSDNMNLGPGNYSVFAINAAGCSDTASFVITEPPVLSLDTVSLVNPTCAGVTNGSVSVQATGGNGGPYTYLWIGLTPGPSLSNLSEGTYCVSYSDAAGVCVDTACITLSLPLAPAITSFDSVSVKCGADGCLQANAPSATSFNWTTLSGTPIGNTAQVCGLDGDTYVVVVTDANGCTNTDTVSLATQQVLFFSDTTFTLPSCFGYPDGTIAVGIMGGNPPYTTFQWSVPSPSSPILLDVAAGPYSLTVTDATQCTLVGTFNLLNPPPIVSSIAITNNKATCSNVCDGAASITAFYGGNGGQGTFSFIWEDVGLADSARVDLCPGYTSVTITDQNNCFRVDSIFIDSPAPVAASSITATDITCNGGMDGTATIVPTGGNPGLYTYLWSNGGTTATISGLAAATATAPYLVTITDSQGCTGTASVTVDEPAPISVSVDPMNSMQNDCAGLTNGELGVIANGGTPNYNYRWEDDMGNVIGNTAIITDLAAGNYAITVTDANGCTGINTLFLQDPPPVIGSILPWDSLTCFGDQTTLRIDTIYGGSGGPFLYSLDYGVQLDINFPQIMTGGKHYVSYFDYQGCETIDTIFVYEPEKIPVIFDPLAITVALGDSIRLPPTVLGALVDMLQWTPSATLSNPDTLTPWVFTTSSESYKLQVWDANGCTGEGTVFIRIDPNRNIYIPNIFLPGNTKGLNDHFNVFAGKGVELVNYMQVYDRWGELLYERENFLPDGDNFAEGWDGKHRGSYVSPGVYIYIIEVKFLDGRVLLYRGDVTVTR
ncbi:MAG: gliding motility-associated C-terminal domain-containing protein [Lewinellaceae bacterium]|nr:gliding motility-associated C-terminal domain-containing protein [Lewinellaceae bacterium]